jgi:hypothetical protein
MNPTGIWYGDQIILIQDSVMTNPFWASFGFFYYSIINDTLVLEDLESSGKIEFIDENHFYLFAFNQNNDTLKFERVTKSNSIEFESLIFEGGSIEGRLPFFKMHIDKYGLVTYEGGLYSALKGKHKIRLDKLSINQLNQLFEIVDIWNYPKEELPPMPGTGNLNLIITYPEDQTVIIEDGVFDGKYFIIQKVFNRFESLIIKKKAHCIILDSAGVQSNYENKHL